jgi:hypothetical protein
MCKILECCYIPYFPVLMLRSPVLKKYVLQHEKKDTILLAYYYLTVTAQWRYLNQVSFHVSSCQPLSSRYVWWKKGLMVYKHDIFLLNFFVSTQPTYMKQDIKKKNVWLGYSTFCFFHIENFNSKLFLHWTYPQKFFSALTHYCRKVILKFTYHAKERIFWISVIIVSFTHCTQNTFLHWSSLLRSKAGQY